jgi:hypothetical protein
MYDDKKLSDGVSIIPRAVRFTDGGTQDEIHVAGLS